MNPYTGKTVSLYWDNLQVQIAVFVFHKYEVNTLVLINGIYFPKYVSEMVVLLLWWALELPQNKDCAHLCWSYIICSSSINVCNLYFAFFFFFTKIICFVHFTSFNRPNIFWGRASRYPIRNGVYIGNYSKPAMICMKLTHCGNSQNTDNILSLDFPFVISMDCKKVGDAS